MKDYLQEIQNICIRYYGKKEECTCRGCPFDAQLGNYGLQCDSGHYGKDMLEVANIKEIIEKEE